MRSLSGEEPAPHSRRVLVIDDHVDTAESMAACLRMAGHRVEVACEGLAGLEVARRFLPEVILCDIVLPGVDGYYVVRALQTDPQFAQCYFVAMSGYPFRTTGGAHAFTEYISKPIATETLLEVVDRSQYH